MATVIFDLDGTLADTSGDLIAAANSRFRALGLGDLLHPGRDDRIAVRGARAMLREGFARSGSHGEEEVERQYRPLLADYDAAIDVHTRLYPGAMEAVESLRSAGHGVGICTNKPEGLAEKLLRSLGVRGAFRSLVGADTVASPKPDPMPYREAVARAGGRLDRSLLVGDTETDRKTARAAGVPSILVTFGPAGRDEVQALAPEALLEDYADLAAVVDRLIG